MMERSDDRVHPAARGFDRAAQAYERGRPEYPGDAVRFLSEKLGIRPGRRVLELAAGTGKLTRALIALGASVVAVEPSDGMRSVFQTLVPSVEVLDGTAEAIPASSRSVDAVVVGQAFHWFRGPEALSEIARVLVSGGGLGLAWNEQDLSVDWVARLARIREEFSSADPPHSRDDAWKSAFEQTDLFTPLEHARFPFRHRTTIEAIVDRTLSVSVIAVQPEEVRRRVAAETRTLLSTDPGTRGREFIDYPYATDVYVARLRPG